MNKPCPLCGKDDLCIVDPYDHVSRRTLYQVVCTNCGSSGPFKDTPEKAWSAWNTRPGEEELWAKLDAALRQVTQLNKACDLYKEASYQSHSGHWDREGTGGRHCPECIRARELRDLADKARKVVEETK